MLDANVSATKSIFYKQIKTLHLEFTGREALNTDAHKENLDSEPVMVRVYQLRDNKAFKKTVYGQLVNDVEETLKDDLLPNRSVAVKPSLSASLDVPMDKDAKFIAVMVVLFRHPDVAKDHWRVTLNREELDPDKPSIFELGNNRLTLMAVKE